MERFGQLLASVAACALFACGEGANAVSDAGPDAADIACPDGGFLPDGGYSRPFADDPRVLAESPDAIAGLDVAWDESTGRFVVVWVRVRGGLAELRTTSVGQGDATPVRTFAEGRAARLAAGPRVAIVWQQDRRIVWRYVDGGTAMPLGQSFPLTAETTRASEPDLTFVGLRDEWWVTWVDVADAADGTDVHARRVGIDGPRGPAFRVSHHPGSVSGPRVADAGEAVVVTYAAKPPDLNDSAYLIRVSHDGSVLTEGIASVPSPTAEIRTLFPIIASEDGTLHGAWSFFDSMFVSVVPWSEDAEGRPRCPPKSIETAGLPLVPASIAATADGAALAWSGQLPGGVRFARVERDCSVRGPFEVGGASSPDLAFPAVAGGSEGHLVVWADRTLLSTRVLARWVRTGDCGG